jgi:hypothetical protein
MDNTTKFQTACVVLAIFFLGWATGNMVNGELNWSRYKENEEYRKKLEKSYQAHRDQLQRMIDYLEERGAVDTTITPKEA